jgi:CRISPR/Cas system-associated endonuclease Cas1
MANSAGSHGLVFDLMEPLRPLAYRGVLEFVQATCSSRGISR